MARGKPRLATWVDNTIRVYELSETGFVQIQSSGLNASNTLLDNGVPVDLVWSADGTVLYGLAWWQSSSVNTASLNFVTQAVSNLNVALATNAVYRNRFTRSSYRPDVFGNLNRLIVDPQSRLITGTSAVNLITHTTSNFQSLWTQFSDNLSFIVSGDLASEARIRVAGINSAPDTFHWPTAAVSFLTTYRFKGMKISADSKFIYGLTSTGVILNVKVALNPLLITASDPITDSFGNAENIAVSRNTRFVAVSYRSVENTFKTVIYRRLADDLVAEYSIDSFGEKLDFTEDGTMLIDAPSKKAYWIDSDGVPSEAVGFLTNVVGGVLFQSVSPHIDNPVGMMFLYDAAVSALALGTANLGALKIALLNSSASFNANHSTLAQVTASGPREVFGGGWPQGGRLIENGGFVPISSNTIGLAASTLRQVTTADLTFASAVIYDDSEVNDRPLAFVEFSEAQTINSGAELVLNFTRSGPFLISD